MTSKQINTINGYFDRKHMDRKQLEAVLDFNNLTMDAKYIPEIMELLKVMDEIAKKHQATVSEVALNWSTQQEFVATALVGVRSRKHVEENCAAFEWMLETEEVNAISSKIIELGL